MTSRKRTRPTSIGVLAGGPSRTAEDERADVVAWMEHMVMPGWADLIRCGCHIGAAARARKAVRK